MMRLARRLAAVTLCCARTALGGPTDATYFKEDHGTGAMYIALKGDATDEVVGREHMGVSVEETGTWSKTGPRITFSPNKKGATSYTAEQVEYKGRTFLTMTEDGGPSIVVPTKDAELELDRDPKRAPMYVFFAIPKSLYEQETKQTYPFRTRPKMKD